LLLYIYVAFQRCEQEYKEASDMKNKDYEQRTSKHTINLVLRNYNDNNVGVVLVMMFYGVHFILISFKK
jgi:hypothetical protein